MWLDPVVEEVRERRRELMAEFDYNPQKIIEGIKKEMEKYSDRLVYSTKKTKKTYKKKSTTLE
jgi:hypothetical protein